MSHERDLALRRVAIPNLDGPIMTRRHNAQCVTVDAPYTFNVPEESVEAPARAHIPQLEGICLLYTSDAADDCSIV